MRQNVFIFGASGNVGRELINQIAAKDVPEAKRNKNPTVVVGLADSKDYIVNPAGFSQEVLKRFTETRMSVAQLMEELDMPKNQEEEGSPVWDRAHESMQELGFGNELIYVDVTAAKEEALAFHRKIMEEGGKIATANKNPIGLFSYEDYQQLTADPKRYGYRSTAMAGLGAVPWISERDEIGDSTHEIKASLSGTVGFITDALQKGKKLSQAIREAKELGYTEPDFRDDLNGIDVARKLVILAREAGHAVNLSDIIIEKILPDEYFEGSQEECLTKIETELDEQMATKYSVALERGKTFKYLATMKIVDGKPVMKIGLEKVDATSSFGTLTGTANHIEVVTDMHKTDNPWKLSGAGAGLEVTASNVRVDIMTLQPKVERFWNRAYTKVKQVWEKLAA